MRKLHIFFTLFSLFFSEIALAQAVPLPTGRAVTVDDLLLLGQSIGGFLILAGGILAGITIIITGIMYLFAGSSTQRLGFAKGMFKAGIIGALIIFGSGIIISTLRSYATNPLYFFGGGGGAQTYCNGGLRAGQLCTSGNECPNEFVCGGPGEPLCSYSLCI